VGAKLAGRRAEFLEKNVYGSVEFELEELELVEFEPVLEILEELLELCDILYYLYLSTCNTIYFQIQQFHRSFELF